MPIVSLQIKQSKELEEIAEQLAKELTVIISQALDIPENPNARLSDEDIEVRVTQPGKLDQNAKDLEVLIFAHDYPERTQNIEERKDKIIAGVQQFLARCSLKVTGWVWILPQQESAFGKI